jgi:hypothetical protein
MLSRASRNCNAMIGGRLLWPDRAAHLLSAFALGMRRLKSCSAFYACFERPTRNKLSPPPGRHSAIPTISKSAGCSLSALVRPGGIVSKRKHAPYRSGAKFDWIREALARFNATRERLRARAAAACSSSRRCPTPTRRGPTRLAQRTEYDEKSTRTGGEHSWC